MISEKFLETSVIDDFKLTYISTDNTIGQCLKEGQLWGDWLDKHISVFYKENTNMIDVGGFIGTCSLQMSKYVSEGNKVYTFEPIYYDILEKNIQNNHLDEKICLFKTALGNKEKVIKTSCVNLENVKNYGFSVIQNDDIIIDHQLNENNESMYLTIKTLDSYDLKDISLIKIDAENMEHQVLLGGLETIKKYNPTIIIKLWSTSTESMEKYKNRMISPFNVYESFTLLSQLGYMCIPIRPESDNFMFIHLSKCKLKID